MDGPGGRGVVGPVEGHPEVGLSVSPDERHVLYAESEQSSELMLVENFH